MSDAFYIAATGMQAQQLHLDTIANNLANVNTMGFKKSRVSFAELMVQGPAVSPLAAAAPDVAADDASRSAAGVGTYSIARQFDLGEMKQSGSPYDVAIQGDGFFELTLADGASAFARGATLKLNPNGQLATQAGNVLKPGITIPDNAQAFVIGADGRVSYTLAGQNSAIEVGQLQLARFANPGGLAADGDGVYRSTAASGEAIAGRAGQDGMGSLAQGYLETSNVKLIDEMVNMMIAQRGYEASMKVVQAADELSGMVNNLRK